MSAIMKNAIFVVSLALFGSGCSDEQSVSSRSNEPSFDHYGIFAQTERGPVELRGFQFTGLTDHFQGSNASNPLVVPQPESGKLKIWVHAAVKSGEFTLLTDLKVGRGNEYVCCFNCGSYESNPQRVCRPVDITEKVLNNPSLRLFEVTVDPGTFCFMEESGFNRRGYIFKVARSSSPQQICPARTNARLQAGDYSEARRMCTNICSGENRIAILEEISDSRGGITSNYCCGCI